MKMNKIIETSGTPRGPINRRCARYIGTYGCLLHPIRRNQMSKHRDVKRAEQIMDDYLEDLKNIVNIDSGTFTKAGIDRVGAYLQERFQAFGFSTRFERQEEYGDHLVATHTGKSQNGPRIVLIGHIDTVFPEGEVGRRPFSISQRD